MFREMRYVYEVYRERSFSRAAQKLYISQPSLSLMIKKAEERVGSPLFDRSTMPIGLTEAGRQYIRAAEQIMEIEGSFQQYISDTEACLSGTLALGGTTLFTSYVLPPLISAFSDRFPRVQVRILEAHTAALERELREGELDFVMENCAFDPAVYDSIAYRAERLLLAVPASFAINEAAAAYRLTAEELQAGRNAPGVPLALFKDEPFLLLKEGNDTRQRADRLCAKAGFRPGARLLLDQQLTAYNLACYGLGVTFVSDTLACSVPPDERLHFYLLDSPHARRAVSLVYKRSRFVTRPMREFLQLLSIDGK